MNFKDADKNNVQALLSLLRTTQDPGPSASASSSGVATNPSPQRPLHRNGSGSHSHPGAAAAKVPTSKQVEDLFLTLNSSSSSSTSSRNVATPSYAPASTSGTGSSTAGGSAFSGAKHNLIEPFGPVGSSSRPPAGPLPYDPYVPTGDSVVPPKSAAIESNIAGLYGSSLATLTSRNGHEEEGDRKGKRRARGDPKFGVLGFKEALPFLVELLADEEFVREMKKLKKDQDNLERRLWAKQEKVKAEHERQVKAEKDIARIARKAITAEKQALRRRAHAETQEWSAKLKSDLAEFYRSQCLPAIDGLAERQRRKMEELGVPGLEGDLTDAKVKERVKKILDTLQAGLEE